MRDAGGEAHGQFKLSRRVPALSPAPVAADFEEMLYNYERHYPPEPYQSMGPPGEKVNMPVLQIHGDPYLLPGGLNDTWRWADADLTLVTIQEAGHFVQQDPAELVTHTVWSWLSR